MLNRNGWDISNTYLVSTGSAGHPLNSCRSSHLYRPCLIKSILGPTMAATDSRQDIQICLRPLLLLEFIQSIIILELNVLDCIHHLFVY